jgi:hypothetical protein
MGIGKIFIREDLPPSEVAANFQEGPTLLLPLDSWNNEAYSLPHDSLSAKSS